MEHEETQRQQGLMRSEQAPATLLPGVLARLEQRQALLADRSIDALRIQLTHSQWEIRAGAIRALGASEVRSDQDAHVIREALLSSLQDEHRLVRVAAIRALLQYPQTDRSKEANLVPPLTLPNIQYANKSIPEKSSGDTLGSDIPVDTLLLSLRDPDWEVREMTVLVLAKLGSLHLDPLQALLQIAQQDTHTSVREAATYALQIYRSEGTNSKAEVVQKLDPVGNDTTLSKQGMFLPLSLTRCLNIFIRQIPLIHKSVWLVPPLFLILWFVQNAYILSGTGKNIHEAGLYLALLSTISAGVGSAFLYGAERDAAFELTLSTPTSLRILMLCRFVLVVGFNILLVGVVSAATVIFYGGSLWDIMQLWLGPVLLIASLSLMLSMLLGTLLALSVAFLLEASQSLVLGLFGHAPTLAFSFSNNWQTSPMFLLLALLLLAFALFYAPRQPRFATM